VATQAPGRLWHSGGIVKELNTVDLPRFCFIYWAWWCRKYGTIPLCWFLFTNLFRSTKPGDGIAFCMILALVFFVCYVGDKVVSFSDSIPIRNVA